MKLFWDNIVYRFTQWCDRQQELYIEFEKSNRRIW